MVVWNTETGEFRNAKYQSDLDQEKAADHFQDKHPQLKVVHIGEGDLPPRTFRSLPYI